MCYFGSKTLGNEKILETRIKDAPKKRIASEIKVKRMAEDIETKDPVASPVQVVKTLTAKETPQGAGV